MSLSSLDGAKINSTALDSQACCGRLGRASVFGSSSQEPIHAGFSREHARAAAKGNGILACWMASGGPLASDPSQPELARLCSLLPSLHSEPLDMPNEHGAGVTGGTQPALLPKEAHCPFPAAPVSHQCLCCQLHQCIPSTTGDCPIWVRRHEQVQKPAVETVGKGGTAPPTSVLLPLITPGDTLSPCPPRAPISSSICLTSFCGHSIQGWHRGDRQVSPTQRGMNDRNGREQKC